MSEQSHDLAVSRALVKTLLRSKEFVVHCEARLGDGAVPNISEFSSRDVAVMDRCCLFLEFVAENLNNLRFDIDSREAQPELPLGGPIEEKEEALAVQLGGGKKRKAAE